MKGALQRDSKPTDGKGTSAAMPNGPNQPALQRLGYFGEASYISIGEPFDTKRAGAGSRIPPPRQRESGRCHSNARAVAPVGRLGTWGRLIQRGC